MKYIRQSGRARTAAKIFIIKCFDPTLRITKSCCRAVPDDRFGLQNDSTCTIVGFSDSAFTREDGIWRKGTINFLWNHLAVDMSKWQASSCAKQPPVSMEGSVPRCRARTKGRRIGRKQESIFELGAWTYISHWNLRSTILFFAGLYTGGRRRERRAYICYGDQVKTIFLILF